MMAEFERKIEKSSTYEKVTSWGKLSPALRDMVAIIGLGNGGGGGSGGGKRGS